MKPPTMTSRQYKKLRRAELFGEQNGLCFWCDEPMTLRGKYPPDGRLAPKDCTIDHLRDRDNPRRQEQPCKERRWVAACFECNHERDNSRRNTNQSQGMAA